MNKKPVLVLSAPIDTYSGYGARFRDFAKSLISLDRYDVRLLSQKWGNTRFGFLEDHGEFDLLDRVVTQLSFQPDIWIQGTIANEFQKVGKINIGATAGIETTFCDVSWVQGSNQMDLIIASSKHAKDSIATPIYQQQDKNTNQIINSLKLEKPIEILFEGVNTEVYTGEPSEEFDLSYIKEDFVYLFSGHWMSGDFGEDRKNVGFMIKCFLEAFKNRSKLPALLLKTSHTGTSVLDKVEVIKKINHIKKMVKGRLPNIYLLHGDLSDEQMNSLYSNPKIKAYVTLTKGEGFNRPALEFSVTGKPIIASNWSGHLDFLIPEGTKLVEGGLTDVHPSATSKGMIIEKSKWFSADAKDSVDSFVKVYKEYDKFLEKAKLQKKHSISNFTLEKMTEKLDEYMKTYVDPNIVQEVELKLPDLDLPKLELPKF